MSGALGGVNCDFQMKQNLYRGKSDGMYIIILERTWEKLLLVAHAIVATEDWWLTSASHSPGIPGTRLYWGLLLPLGPRLLLAASLLEPSLFRTRQLSGSCDFQWLSISRLTASLSQRHLTVTCPLLPRVMKTLPCALRTLPSPAPARELPQRVWCGCRSRKFCRRLAPSACPWEAVHDLLLPQRSWTDGRGRAGCVTRRDFRVNGLLQLPDLLLCVLSRSVMSNSVTPWTVACQAPVSTGILQARTLEWVAMPSSRGSSQPRDQTQVSRIAGGFFTIWASREAHSEVAGWSEGTGPCHDYSASSRRWSPQHVAQNGFVAPIAKATEWAGTTTEWS